MKTETHHIKLPKRIGVCILTEHPDRIEVTVHFSKIGDFGDVAELEQWLTPIYERYDNDPRPVVSIHPRTGETAVVWGDANNSIGMIIPP